MGETEHRGNGRCLFRVVVVVVVVVETLCFMVTRLLRKKARSENTVQAVHFDVGLVRLLFRRKHTGCVALRLCASYVGQNPLASPGM